MTIKEIKRWIGEYDDEVAKAAGWALFQCDDGILRIQKLDESNRFESDQEAIEYVRAGAALGSQMMQAALRLHLTKP